MHDLIHSLTDPVALWGHMTYLLLVVSMMMRRMVWLRSLAIVSGLAKIVYRGWLMFDPVSLIWEVVFVSVNVIQLAIIWYYQRYHRFGADEQSFVAAMPANVERRALRRLLRLARVREFEAGAQLVREGEPVPELLHVTAGVVRIEKAGRMIAACGSGDYLGEMSFLSGKPASASAIASKPVRALAFDKAALTKVLSGDTNLRRALEAGLNLNLVGKLARSSEGMEGAAAE